MSNIEWTDTTWQVTSGCTKVSDGCKHCYAETMAHRLAGMAAKDVREGKDPGKKASYSLVVTNGRWNNKVVTLPENLTEPLHWKKPRMIFVNSMSDLFHEAVPFDFIDKVFAVMALCPQHTFQILTKRPERMAEYMTRREISKAWTPSVRAGDGGSDSAKWKTPCDSVYMIARQMKGRDAAPELIWPLPNVWLGTSVEDQTRADERIPHLLRCPAQVRFLSCEPLLGPVDLKRYMAAAGYRVMQKMHPCDESRVPDHLRYNGPPSPDWVIVGGESGAKSRPCDVAWVRSIVSQCKAAAVPCFVKQLGANCGDTPAGGEWIKGRFNKSADECGYTGVRRLNDRKGGDPSEWPADLRVRQMPEVAR